MVRRASYGHQSAVMRSRISSTAANRRDTVSQMRGSWSRAHHAEVGVADTEGERGVVGDLGGEVRHAPAAGDGPLGRRVGHAPHERAGVAYRAVEAARVARKEPQALILVRRLPGLPGLHGLHGLDAQGVVVGALRRKARIGRPERAHVLERRFGVRVGRRSLQTLAKPVRKVRACVGVDLGLNLGAELPCGVLDRLDEAFGVRPVGLGVGEEGEGGGPLVVDERRGGRCRRRPR